MTPVARGPVPRERWLARALARACPSPYGEREGFLPPRPRGRAALLHRDRGVSPTGTSLALRSGWRTDTKKSRPGGLSYREDIEI